MKRAIITALVLLAAGAAHAQSTGNKLLAALNAPAGSQDRMWAIAYVDGTLDSYALAHTIANTDPPICMPAGVTLGQAMDVTKQYLEENPAQRHLPAASFVIGAAARAWPCLSTPVGKAKPGKGRAL